MILFVSTSETTELRLTAIIAVAKNNPGAALTRGGCQGGGGFAEHLQVRGADKHMRRSSAVRFGSVS
jgi:hypothetical protein